MELEAGSSGGHPGLHLPQHPVVLGSPGRSPKCPPPCPSRFSQGQSFLSAAAPRNPNREVAGDTIIFRDTQISSRAVYQCNTSNEHGYLLANAFVSVLGESSPPLSHGGASLGLAPVLGPLSPLEVSQAGWVGEHGTEEAWRLKMNLPGRMGNFSSMELGVQTVNSILGSGLQRRGRGLSHPLHIARPTLPAFSVAPG